MIKNQQGFIGVLSFLICLSFLSLLFLEFATAKTREQKLSQAAPFYDQMKHTIQQINAYQMDRVGRGLATVNSLDIFPHAWSLLEPNYLPRCNHNDEKNGICLPSRKTPWGTEMQIKLAYSGWLPQMTITIPMQPKNDMFALERDAYIGALGKLPGARMDESQNAVLLVISRLDNAIQHDGLVKRSGNNSTLTGDWDVGGQKSIVNAKDVTIRNSDGSQRSLSAGIIDSLVAKNGQRIPKPKCPNHLKPKIQVSLKSTLPDRNYPADQQWFDTLHQVADYETQSNHWVVGLSYWAKLKSGDWIKKHDGEINVQLFCLTEN